MITMKGAIARPVDSGIEKTRHCFHNESQIRISDSNIYQQPRGRKKQAEMTLTGFFRNNDACDPTPIGIKINPVITPRPVD